MAEGERGRERDRGRKEGKREGWREERGGKRGVEKGKRGRERGGGRKEGERKGWRERLRQSGRLCVSREARPKPSNSIIKVSRHKRKISGNVLTVAECSILFTQQLN